MAPISWWLSKSVGPISSNPFRTEFESRVCMANGRIVAVSTVPQLLYRYSDCGQDKLSESLDNHRVERGNWELDDSGKMEKRGCTLITISTLNLHQHSLVHYIRSYRQELSQGPPYVQAKIVWI